MKTIIIFIFFSLFQPLFSQSLKNYQGDFKTNNETGIANYYYTENAAFERIYQGNFSFLSKNKLLKIAGQFENNKKNGMWHFWANSYSQPYAYDKGVKNVSFNIYGQYIDGNMEGNWVLKRVVNTSNSGVVQEASIVNYKHNHLIGNFTFSFRYSRTDHYSNRNEIIDQYETVNGSFDNDGEKTGVWTLNSLSEGIKYQNISKYNDDILYFRLIRNSSNGEILYKFENGVESGNSMKVDEFKSDMDENTAIKFWTDQYFRYPSTSGNFYPDLLMYSYSGIVTNNPIYEFTKGSNK